MGDERSANALDKRLGERVRARRLEIGMSQERLAELLGVTFQQVQKYEKGMNRIAASRLYDIAEALELPIERFFEGLKGRLNKPSKHGRTLDNALATPEAVDLVLTFAAIPTVRVRRRVLQLVKTMAAEEKA